MTHKEEVKLNRLLAKIDAMRDIVLCLLSEKGRWNDGTGKDRLAFQVDKAEISDVCVKKTATEYPYMFSIVCGNSKVKFNVTDEDLVAVLEDGVEKVKDAKEKAKQKADEERQKKSNVSYMDVFNRVAKFLKANGYNPTTPKDENDKIVMKVAGNVLLWNNVKEFISAPWKKHHANFGDEGCVNIFRAVACWKNHYWKLAYPSLRKLVDKVKVLGEVNDNAVVPVAIMDELDRLKV